MYFGNLFPRNPDGTLKTKLPCQTPGCTWPNWHICLDKSDPEHRRVHAPKRKRRGGPMPESQRLAIAESQRERHAKLRSQTVERDNLIIKHYTEGNLGMSTIASLTGIAQSTINKVLHRAQREGVLKIRPKGYTVARPGRAI